MKLTFIGVQITIVQNLFCCREFRELEQQKYLIIAQVGFNISLNNLSHNSIYHHSNVSIIGICQDIRCVTVNLILDEVFTSQFYVGQLG